MKVFAGTFLLNNLIIWVMAILYYSFISEGAILIVCGILVPITGGILRGIYSTYDTRRFWEITLIWAVILAVGYVPLYAMVSDATSGEFGVDIVLGLVIAGMVVYKGLYTEVQDREIYFHLLGVVEGAILLSIFNYYFGSSLGSKNKDKNLKDLIR